MIYIRSFAFNVFYIGWTLFMSVILTPGVMLPQRYMLWLTWFWPWVVIRLMPYISGISLEVRGREHISKTPVIYAVKHQSAMEIFALLSILHHPVYLLKRELLMVPFFGMHLMHAGMIGVDRSKGASAMKRILKNAELTFSRGRSLIIFPEGTRVAPGTKGEYQSGVAAMYRHLNVPVVPVALNTGLFWGKNSFLKTPGNAVIEFLPAIAPGLPPREFMTQVEAAIEGASAKLLAGQRPT